MYLHNGFKFSRFGEEMSGDVGISERYIDEKVRQIVVIANNAYNDLEKRINAIEKIGQLYSVTNTYFSTKGRRIVSVKKGVDKTDVVIMEQLNEVHDKVKNLLKGIEVTNDCIKIKGHRRICGVTKAKEPYDVVIDLQRSESNDKLVLFQTEINKSLSTLQEEINTLREINNVKKIMGSFTKPVDK